MKNYRLGNSSFFIKRSVYSFKCWCTNLMAILPSPTAEAMRAIAPEHPAHLAVFDAKHGVALGPFSW